MKKNFIIFAWAALQQYEVLWFQKLVQSKHQRRISVLS